MQRLMEHQATVSAGLRDNQQQRKRLRDDVWCWQKNAPPTAAVACASSLLLHGEGDTKGAGVRPETTPCCRRACGRGRAFYLATPMEGLAVAEHALTQQHKLHVQRGRAFLAERRLSG
jgi:hypothetical protein